MYTFVPIICIITRLFGTIHSKDKYLRVVYGNRMNKDDYPYAVTILRIFKNGDDKDVFVRWCTASVIAEQWTLTAGHCAENRKTQELLVWYDRFTVSPLLTKLYSEVLKIFTHQSYRRSENEYFHITVNDICLLHTQKITFKSYGSISAVDHTTMIGLPVKYVGGGETNKPGDDELRPLQVGEAVISTCDAEMKESGKYIICISPKCSNKMQQPWFGDSGGPLVFDGKIIGVLSFGNLDIVVNAYTPTSPYLDWLHAIIHSED